MGNLAMVAGRRELLKTMAHVTPSDIQYNWQAMEFTAFVVFGMNTFTGREWGTGFEKPGTFHPTGLDTDQWCRVLAETGFKMAILTVKHHEGFCLWPTRYTKHSVASSAWREGNGDVMADFAASCRKYGIKAGFYLSPADLYQIESEPGFGSGLYGNESKARLRTIPEAVPNARPFTSDQTFTYELDDYNAYFMNQLYELLTEYGEISEVWFDGAHPKRKGDQQYNHRAWAEMIRSLQPEIIIHGNGMNEMRWVGNEAGYAREEEWNVLPAEYAATSPWRDTSLGSRKLIESLKENKFVWLPAETDVSIRPGWFYHKEQDLQVKTPEHLHKIYLESIGRNTTLLLNFPPDQVGVIHDNDVKNMCEFRQRLDTALAVDFAEDSQITASHCCEGHEAGFILDGNPYTYWTTDPWQEKAELTLNLPAKSTFNMIVLQEAIKQGQRIESFTIRIKKDGNWEEVCKGKTVGYKRIFHLVRPVTTDSLRICINESRYAPTLCSLSLHKYPESVVAPEVDSDDGMIHISLPAARTFVSKGEKLESPVDTTGYEVHFTTDGSVPTRDSAMYTEPFNMICGDVRARSFVEESGEWKMSSKTFYKVPYPKERLTILERPTKAEESLVIQLDSERSIAGIAFDPVADDDIVLISSYKLAVSLDGSTWQTVCEAERFDNILNDPTPREQMFDAIEGRYITFVPLCSENERFDIDKKHIRIFIEEIK